MSQSFVVSDPSTGLGLWKSEDGGALEALRSSFSGTAFPSTPAPVDGQRCYRTDLDADFIYRDVSAAWWPVTALDRAVGASATTGTSEETLRTKTINGDLKLNADGKGLLIKARVVFAANANNKRVRLQFDGTDIVDTGNVAFNGSSIELRAEIQRTGATAQSAWGKITCTNAATLAEVNTQSNPAKTLANDLVLALKVTTPTALGEATVIWWEILPIT